MELHLAKLILVGTIVCIGTVGNILSFITVSNKHCKKSSYTVYLAGLAIADLLALYSLITLPQWQLGNVSVNLKNTSELYCKLHLFFAGLFTAVSIWLIVVLSLERAFVVYFPFKAKSACRPKKAFIVTTLLVTFFIAFNAHYIYGVYLHPDVRPKGNASKLNAPASGNFGRYENASLSPLTAPAVFDSLNNNKTNNADNENDYDYGEETNNEDRRFITNSCGFVDKRYAEFYRSWVVIESTFYFLLPVLVIVTANALTWIKVYKQSHENLASTTAMTLRRTRHVLILTTFISVGFIIFVTPVTVILLAEAILTEDFAYPLYNEGTGTLLGLTGECLYLCNHSINFFMYILSGKRFRNSLKAAFCKPSSAN